MFKVILWDIDGTLLDFNKAEGIALDRCFKHFSLGAFNEDLHQSYHLINKKYWEALERGEYTKAEILVKRFEEFFKVNTIEGDAKAFNEHYQNLLGETASFQKNGEEVVKALKGKYLQCAVTNGTYVAQKKKLSVSGLDQLLDEIFISDLMGVQKPNVEFFDYVFQKIGHYSKDEVIIIGDSLTGDMQGGINAGIKTCFYDPKKTNDTQGLKVDYHIYDLIEVLSIV